METFAFLAIYGCAYWLTWSAVARNQRNKGYGFIRQHGLGFLAGSVYSMLPGMLTVPSDVSWWQYLLAFLFTGVAAAWRENAKKGLPLFYSGKHKQVNEPTPDVHRQPGSVWPTAPAAKTISTPQTVTSSVVVNGGLAELREICREMTADGSLDEEEIYDLKHWLDDHPHAARDGLACLLADQIRDVLADGEISVYEAFDLLDLAEAVAQGKTLAEMVDWQPLAPMLDAQLPESERPRHKVRSGRRVEGGKLDTIHFAYRNAEGEHSERRVVVRVLVDDYFEGLCLSRQATRTFRLDRILGKVTSELTGEMADPYEWASGLGHCFVPLSSVHPAIEVLFTGFLKAERSTLENLAEASGMVVRKSVTQNLGYLCAGPKASPSKLDQASSQGVRIVSKEEFAALV